ncbi:KAT8 regulatory NSL complex subunit 2-like isoform X2 [Amphiura filiformis]|uniref:KAT8 regulatory NSL complex subunit 2-like isoform X2 n=1 Tax=Amphiura filiformis TaxID=82378 RepID=UPI003B21950F
MQDRLDGFEYCFNHILEDKNSPYKQCQFISSKNGRRCINPAPKADKKDGYCSEHARRARLLRQKAALKPKPPSSTKELFEELDYYRTGSTKAVPDLPVSSASKILEYGSDSESDDEPLLVEQTWRGCNDSDAESVDSEQEDLLKHAGVYTAEEVALITMDKLIRLQSLYINQFKRLQHLMKEKRRKYLKAVGQEQDTIGTDLGKITNPHEKVKFAKLQAMRSYRRRRGKEALLQRKSKQRRIKTTPEYTGPQQTRIELQCSHVQDGKQCEKPTLPIARFCGNHILSDPLQVLFSPCVKGQGLCQRPASILSEEGCCLLHTTIPPRQLRLRPEEEANAPSAMTDHDYGQRPTETNMDGGGDRTTNMTNIASELASSLAQQLSTQSSLVSAGGDATSKAEKQLERQMLKLQQQIQQQIQEQQRHMTTFQPKIIQQVSTSTSVPDTPIQTGATTETPIQAGATTETPIQAGAATETPIQAATTSAPNTTIQTEKPTPEPKPSTLGTPELMVLQKPKGQFPIIQLHPLPKTPDEPKPEVLPKTSDESKPEAMEIDPSSASSEQASSQQQSSTPS